MAGIKDITGLSKHIESVKQKEKVKQVQKKNPAQTGSVKEIKSVFSDKDRVEISTKGHVLSTLKAEVDIFVSELLPKEISQTKIEELHKKIDSDFYSKPEVIDKIVSSLIASVEFSDYLKEVQNTSESLTEEQLNRIKSKIDDGEYDSEEVTEKIVNELLKDL